MLDTHWTLAPRTADGMEHTFANNEDPGSKIIEKVQAKADEMML
eukprot:SAG31_NODE_24375_length_483_cov_0.523438_1_plen_43_part_10